MNCNVCHKPMGIQNAKTLLMMKFFREIKAAHKSCLKEPSLEVELEAERRRFRGL